MPFLRGLMTVGSDRASFVWQTVSASLRLSCFQTRCSLGVQQGDGRWGFSRRAS